MTVPAATPPSIIFRPTSILEYFDFGTLFPKPQPVHLEIGSGDGSFLVQYAKAHPGLNFLGIERLLGRLRKIEKKSLRLGLTNVRGTRLEASYLVRYLMPPRSLSAVHIYFPDPWPKRRHWKNRLITTEFTVQLERALLPEAVVYLRTDNVPYFEQMLESFAANPRFKAVESPSELKSFITDFEREFHKRGVQTNHAAYQLLAN